MNNLDYLGDVTKLVRLHARAQGIGTRECSRTLAAITTLDDGDSGWADVWTATATAHAEKECHLAAVRRFNLARFPFVSTPGQKAAYRACTGAFGTWAADVDGAEKLSVDVGGSSVPVWFRGLPSDEPQPLLFVIGGIVSPKEQWAEMLTSARALGMAVVIADFPGVGENSMRYAPSSAALVSAVIDAVSTRMVLSGVHALAMSFGGTLVLKAAATDPRIRSVVTVGAPVRYLFAPQSISSELPPTTLRTLEHVTGASADDLAESIADCAVQDRELDRLKIPVLYFRSRHDEICPTAESLLLQDRVVQSRIVEFDDVHGSPAHMTALKLRTVQALASQTGRAPLVDAALSLAVSLGSRARALSPIDFGRSVA